ncbi:MAG: hypothetical protein KAS17_01875 [Victivallaceae bacterium]|nr:hypothetical protein [Victivallaceae bacterium]
MDRFIVLFSKNYIDGDVGWMYILILFTFLVLPLVVKSVAKANLKYHMGYFSLVFFDFGILTCLYSPLGKREIMFAMFLAFPIGYSIYCIRTKKKEKTFGIFILVVFLIIIGLVILHHLPGVIEMLAR